MDTDSDRRYPLIWPEGWKRTQHKTSSRYRISQEKAHDKLVKSLRLLGARTIVVSTNVALRQDGRPYANRPRPIDCGVAVYWSRKGEECAIACDKWVSVAENMRAVGLAIEALRQLERCGASEILDRAFRGFTSLPAKGGGEKGWRYWLGFDPHEQPSVLAVYGAFRTKAKKYHPDASGGSDVLFKALTTARDQAIEELSK